MSEIEIVRTGETLSMYKCTELILRKDGNSGFGYGSGNISRQKRLEDGTLTAEVESIAIEYVTGDKAFLPIEADDTGCGDGRRCAKIMQLQGEDLVVYKKSLRRAKVFGGDLLTSAVSILSSGGQNFNASQELFKTASDLLISKGILYGAHTDEHASGQDCGCGAIDKFPIILANIVRYDNEIKTTLRSLMGDSFDEDAYVDAKGNLQHALETIDFSKYSGKDTMGDIIKSGAVVKELSGSHREILTVINTQPNTTLNQAELCRLTNDEAQAFCVDLWRLQSTSNAFAEAPDKMTKTLFGNIIMTASVSATLTDGSQRLFINK